MNFLESEHFLYHFEKWFNPLTVLASVLFIFLILNKFLTLRCSQKWFAAITCLLLTGLSNPVIYPEEVTGSLTVLAGFVLYVFVFFRGTMIERLSVCMVLYPMIVSLNFLTEDMGFQIWHMYPQMSPAGQTFLHTFTLMMRIPVWWLVWYTSRRWISRARELTTRMWLVIDIICLSSAVGMVTFIYHAPLNQAYTAYPASIACFLTSIGTIYLTSYVAKTIKTEMEIQNLKYEQSYYQELEKNQAEVRKMRHDMKNHLSVAASFLRNHDTQGAETYLTKLSGELNTGNRNFCKNSIVNAVLNNKYQLAVSNQIDCFCNISIDQMMGIDDVSLCSLFANSLDNAIEACKKIPEPKMRHISVKARYQNGFFSYEITNSKCNEIVTKHGKLISSKKDKKEHGLGVGNMKDMVEKYGGTCGIEYDEGRFIVTVLIGGV